MIRRPLVLKDGSISELPIGDSLPLDESLDESMVILNACEIDATGIFEITDEASAALKNGVANAFQRIKNIVRVLNTGEVEIDNSATLEVNDGTP